MAEKPGTERPCLKCGMKLVFLEGQSGPGRPMPAQRVRSVYRRVGTRVEKIELTRDLFGDDEWLYVNHYETCPEAGHFSRRGGEAKDGGTR